MKTTENNIKNKVYCAEGDPDYGCIFIAAKTSKEAKYIAMGSWVAEPLDNPYIELRVTRCWSIKETNYSGILNIFEINELGLTWWNCPECNKEEFEILNEDEYQCKNCKHIEEIPYVNS